MITKRTTATATEILSFWFGDSEQDADALARHNRFWFTPDKGFDMQIRSRFLDGVIEAAAGRLRAWERTPPGRLALILLLDQFPRNIYRGAADAFTHDALAREQSLAMIEGGQDRSISPVQCTFAYMPLQHAEDIDLQNRSVDLFSALVDRAPPALRLFLTKCVRYAVDHRDIIARFGRFPHRNAVLDRASTSDEAEYLQAGGRTFGQV